MATKQRYINTASSAGGDGTTNNTTGTTRAFVGWVEFESVEGALDGAGDIYNVQVSGYESLGTTRLLYNDFATTVTLNFYAAAGEESEALPSQGAGFTHSGTANHLWYYCAYTFTDLRFVATSTALNFQFVAGAAVIPTWTNCYINKEVQFPHLASSARTMTLKNSVLAGGISLLANGEAAYIDTIKLVNTVVTERIVTYTYKTVDAKNSTFPAADWLLGAGTYTGATTNAVDCLFNEAYASAQFNGTYSGCTHSVNFSGYFADSANGDYNLTASATAALDAGVGTSDGDVPANDANAVARGATTCDIGPYEYATSAQTLTPGLFTNSQSFYAPTVTPGAVALTPALFSNTQTFYSPTVTLGGATQDLTPARFDNTQSFYAPTVAPGAVTLTPGLYSNTQTFYQAEVQLDALIASQSQRLFLANVGRLMSTH